MQDNLQVKDVYDVTPATDETSGGLAETEGPDRPSMQKIRAFEDLLTEVKIVSFCFTEYMHIYCPEL
mgnify:FL=1